MTLTYLLHGNMHILPANGITQQILVILDPKLYHGCTYLSSVFGKFEDGWP